MKKLKYAFFLSMIGFSVNAVADLTYIHYEGVVTDANNQFSEWVPLPHREGDFMSGTLVVDSQFAYTESYVITGTSFFGPTETRYNEDQWDGHGIHYKLPHGNQRFVTGHLEDDDVGRYNADELRIINGSEIGQVDSIWVKDGVKTFLPDDKAMTQGISKIFSLTFHADDFVDSHGLNQNFTLNEGEFTGRGTIDYVEGRSHRMVTGHEAAGYVKFSLTKITVETVEGDNPSTFPMCY